MANPSKNSSSRKGADVVGFPPLVGLTLVAVGTLLHLSSPIDILTMHGTALIIGVPILVLGIGLQVISVRALKRAGTTPLFKQPTTTVLRNGLYSRSRNPIYVSVLLQFIGLSFVVNSVWFLLTLPILYLYLRLLVITREENYLERQFGQKYLDYKAQVPRWL